jgi:hypothetical protein
MNAVKTLALVASTIGFANIGLSLPAHSQQVASNQAAQTAIVTGNHNVVSQTNTLVINSRGRFNGDNRFRSTTKTTQTAEIQGDSNRIHQASDARIDNSYYPQTNDAEGENGHRRHH